LVALRYEETKQAEPPTPLPPPRNPRRLARTSSTSTSTTAPTSPVTVSPPRVPPPQEEHPLFRAQRPSLQSSSADEWKRDSGAPTSSTITLREEGAEDPAHPKTLDDIADTPSAYSDADDDEEIADPPAPPRTTLVNQVAPAPAPLTVCIPSRLENTEPIVVSPSSPSRRASLSQRLSKSFGIGPDGSKRLRRKKMLGTDRAAAQATPPEMEPERGSPRSPRSPKSPESLKLPPQATGPGPSSADREHPEDPLSSATPSDKSFAPITTPIPDESLWEDLGAVSFSKRGSIMFGGKNNLFKSLMMSAPAAKAHAPPADEHATSAAASPSGAQFTTTHDNAAPTEPHAGKTDEVARGFSADAPSVPSIRVSSMDVERESQKFVASLRSSLSIRSSPRRPAQSHVYYNYSSFGQFLVPATR